MDPKHVGLVRFQKYNTPSMTKNTIFFFFFFFGRKITTQKKKKKKKLLQKITPTFTMKNH